MSTNNLPFPVATYSDDKEDFLKNILWAPRKKRQYVRRVTRGEMPAPRCRKRLVFESDVEKEPERNEEKIEMEMKMKSSKEARVKSVPQLQTPESKKGEGRDASLVSLRRQRTETPNKSPRFDQNIKRKLSLLSSFR